MNHYYCFFAGFLRVVTENLVTEWQTHAQTKYLGMCARVNYGI